MHNTSSKQFDLNFDKVLYIEYNALPALISALFVNGGTREGGRKGEWERIGGGEGERGERKRERRARREERERNRVRQTDKNTEKTDRHTDMNTDKINRSAYRHEHRKDEDK